jgi:hypothetical protein
VSAAAPTRRSAGGARCSPRACGAALWPLHARAQAPAPTRPIFVLNSLDADVSIIDPAT